ncbi:LysE family translocator [Pseudomonas asplenii]|uniref:LysE family translocator n=1 Tax=Pseudomonas asplenii TaxID=53407 RepID=UPI0037C9E71B
MLVSIDQAILTFTVAAIALLASPGPATLALAASGAVHGVRRSLLFFTGIILGLIVAITLVDAGLYIALHGIPWLSTVLMGACSLYILYLAYGIATAEPLNDRPAVSTPGLAAGFMLSLTNIKAYAAFTALLGSFTLGLPLPWEAVAKASICLLVCTVFDVLWLFAGSQLRSLFNHPIWSRALNGGFAILMVLTVAWSLMLAE